MISRFVANMERMRTELVTDEELAEVRIQKNEFHGEWNYTILPNG